MKTCKAWPAERTVRKGYFPLLKNSSLASILTLGRRKNKYKKFGNPKLYMKF
jgi:hypothetical protein